jgi:MFS family permease
MSNIPHPEPARSAESKDAALLAHPPYVLFWFARGFSSFAFQMSAVATGWLVYDRTHNAYALGLVGLAQFLPMLLMSIPAGQLADRFDRRRILTVCQLFEATALASIALGVIFGPISLAHIYVAVVVLGAARACEQPTSAALLPLLVPRAILQRAVALSSSANQTANIVGPAAGGLFYALGAAVPFALAAGLVFAASVLVTLIRVARPQRTREPTTLRSAFSGLAFIWERKVILGAVSLDLFAVLLGGATALLPIYARDILAIGPWGLGLLRSAPAVGALSMSLVLSRLALRRHVGAMMFGSVIAFGAAIFVFALSRNLPLSILALACTGAADNISVVIRSSLVQLQTPDDMRGRVSAVNSLFIGTSNQLGEFWSGTLAGVMGAVPALTLGGCATIAVALVWMRLFPALRRMQTLAG